MTHLPDASPSFVEYLRRVAPDTLPRVAPDALPALPLAGPGAHLVGEASGPIDLDAGWLAAADLPDAGLEPLYLRRPDAEVPTKAKSALPAPRPGLRRTR